MRGPACDQYLAARQAAASTGRRYPSPSIRTLGKQWTYVARVIEGHRLITEGPYNWVRNPIYLAMFGSLVSTGLVFSKWWAFFPAIVIFLIGTQIRISREEKLLSATFGQEWSDYTRRVPALFPGF